MTESEAAVTGIDHVAITVADVDATYAFYARTLDAQVVLDHKVDGRIAVRGIRIGAAMLNVHQEGNGIALVARLPTPGSADICFRWGGDIASAQARLAAAGVPLGEGPVPRTSSQEVRGQSVYFLDPDGNLIELLAENIEGEGRGI